VRILAVIGFVLAVLLHAGFLLFGGLLFMGHGKEEKKVQQVELLAEDLEADKEEEKEPEEKEPEEEVQAEEEPPPDASEVIRNMEAASADQTPALDAATLSAIEAALNPGASMGADFGGSVNLASGGRIGGKGAPGSGVKDGVDDAFSLAELDQKPRVIFQAPPSYPAELRPRKIEGQVYLLFIVDANGRVLNPRVEKASHQAFVKPALDAVKQWKFEPATRGGQKVPCRMRVPIRFSVG
jgi:protein TonB